MKQLNKTFFPHLDTCRFFAFLAVFINHVFNSLGYSMPSSGKFFINNFLRNGDLGVSFFFVLSGFLITYLLLEEKENNGRIDIKKFYIRRILRIWPLYFLIVCLALLLLPHFREFIPKIFPIRFATDRLNPWLYWGFAGNLDYVWNGITNVVIGILWSVSIEEQFYLFWPLIIAFVPKKRLLPVFLLLITGSTLFRFYFTEGGDIDIINYHSFSCASDLIIGALLAYLVGLPQVIERIKNMPRYLIASIYLLGLAALPFRTYIWKFGVHYIYAAALLPVLTALFFGFIIMEQCYARKSFFKAGNLKQISRLGTYTYGMYCYHMTVFFLVLFIYSKLGIPLYTASILKLMTTALLCLLLTVLLSKLSYDYFETKFLQLKKRFASV